MYRALVRQIFAVRAFLIRGGGSTMNVLVPLDGSQLAEQAIEPAALLAKRSQGPTTLLLVRVSPSKQTLIASDEVLTPEFARDRFEEALTYLQQVRQRASLQEIPVQIAVLDGTPAEAITHYAQNQGASLIVMASHVLTTLDRAMWGSVAERIAYRSGIPTLIVRPNTGSFPSQSTGKPFTVLVPLDGSAEAASVLGATSALASGFGGTILLLHVLRELPEDDAGRRRDREQEALGYLEDIARREEQRGVQADTLVAWGDPASHIIDLVRGQRADMIAIATHGRMGLALLQQGSTTDEVFHHVTVPMLIYHPGEMEDTPLFQQHAFPPQPSTSD
jgi:nucleotide-binding universal stress UspA family protein